MRAVGVRGATAGRQLQDSSRVRGPLIDWWFWVSIGTQTRQWLASASTYEPRDRARTSGAADRDSLPKGERPAFAGRPWGGEIRYMDMCAEEVPCVTRGESCNAWWSPAAPERSLRLRRRSRLPGPERGRMRTSTRSAPAPVRDPGL